MTYLEFLSMYPPHPRHVKEEIEFALDEARKAAGGEKRSIVVLDDDPTGTQTVHDVDVYTDWSIESIQSGFGSPMFFVLTNSRAFSKEKTEAVHRDIAQKILAQNEAQKKDFIVVSRGDSTLRGHYPIETSSMNAVFLENNLPMDGEIIVPFFPEGGRYTIGDIHYVRQGEELTPAGETEFAKDKTFGYKSSNLIDWVKEKNADSNDAAGVGQATETDRPVAVNQGETVTSIPLEWLRTRDYERITDALCQCENFGKIIVNAVDYDDLRVFATAFFNAIAKGKRFLFRSAAAMVKVLGGVSDQPLLSSIQLKDSVNPNGGLIVVGSHVARTTSQLETLKKEGAVHVIEMNQHLALDPAAFEQEADRVLKLTEKSLLAGQNTVVMTRRERFDLGTSQEEELRLAVTIGDKLTGIVSRLSVRPSFIIAKGGITSSDVATKGLSIKKARVAGQILPGVPVWQAGAESKYPDLMLIIFPGNVGDEDALLQAVNKFGADE